MNNSTIEDLQNQMSNLSQSLQILGSNMTSFSDSSQIGNSQGDQTKSNAVSIYLTDDNCTIVRKIIYNHPNVLNELIGNLDEETIFMRFALFMKEIFMKYPILQSLATINNAESQQYIYQEIENYQDSNVQLYANLILANLSWIKTVILNYPNESQTFSHITNNKKIRHPIFDLCSTNNNKTNNADSSGFNSGYNSNTPTDNGISISTIRSLLDALKSIRQNALYGKYNEAFDSSVSMNLSSFTKDFRPNAHSSMIENKNEVSRTNRQTRNIKNGTFLDEIENDLILLINWSRFEALNQNYTTDIDIEIGRNLAHVLNKSVPLSFSLSILGPQNQNSTTLQQTIPNQSFVNKLVESNRKLKLRLTQTEKHLLALENLLGNFNSVLINIMDKSFGSEISVNDSEVYSTPLTSPLQTSKDDYCENIQDQQKTENTINDNTLYKTAM